jgi:hypothetical protein
VFKVTVLLTYARQVVARAIDKKQCVPLEQVDRYLLPHIDSGHIQWKATLNSSSDCATL